MTRPFRFSVCNEIYRDFKFSDACQHMKRLGYEGIEIAPFTLAESPRQISRPDRQEFRRIMAEEGLSFVGLHWLMVSPEGLHVTTGDVEQRARSWQHIYDLIDLCADLGQHGVMVFGSPKQRSTVGRMTPREARAIYTDELAKVAPHAQQQGVRILVEALPSNQSDVINTLQEAMAIVDEINSPAVQTMFDTHNALDETEPHADLIKRYFRHIAHVHVNEMDGREPGTGDYDFESLLKTLLELNFNGWVSLEAFDFSRDPDLVAGGSLTYLKSKLPAAGALSESRTQAGAV
jgi:D-psicose/D-tagatose/L-ribulose 3-epimerase